MMQSIRVTAITVVLVLLTIAPTFVFAQFPEKIVTCNGVDCGVCDIARTGQNILNAGIYVAIFLSAILFAWAGWKHVTAGGDSGKVSEARSIFGNVLIGLVVILAAWLIVDTVMKLLFNNDQYGPWNALC